MATIKPSEAEDEYFAKLDVEKKKKIAQKKHSTLQRQEIEDLKKTHRMRCAECGMELQTIVFKGFSIHKCFQCGGAFLSKEAFSRLCGEDTHFLEKILKIFES